MSIKDLHDQLEGIIVMLGLAKELEALHAQRAKFEEPFNELTSTAGGLAGAIREIMDEKSEPWLESNIASTYEELARGLENLEAAKLPEIPELSI